MSLRLGFLSIHCFSAELFFSFSLMNNFISAHKHIQSSQPTLEKIRDTLQQLLADCEGEARK
jgi:hypothetical protein